MITFINKYKYDILFILISHQEESVKFQELSFNCGLAWVSGGEQHYLNVVSDGNYLLMDLSIGELYVGDKLENEYRYFKERKQTCDPKIYTIDDYKIVENILKHGSSGPNYSPKKIVRTLESTTWYPYRFKTEEEMIKQYGYDWRDKAFSETGWNDRMDHLLGKDYPYSKYELNLTVKDDEQELPSNDRFIDSNSNDWEICWGMLTENEPQKPSYKPKKIERTFESTNMYEYSTITIRVENKEELEQLIDMCKPLFEIPNLYTIFDCGCDLPNIMFIYLDSIKNNGKSSISYLDSRTPTSSDIEIYITNNNRADSHIYSIGELSTVENIIKYGKKLLTPNYKPRKIERTFESVNISDKVLHIFDFDDTLVYSQRFEETVKHLIKEEVTPEEILKDEVNKLGINLSQLKYENGRIYLNDPDSKIDVPENSSWVRKKTRIYLVQPESYYTTDESIPIGTYDKMVELYHSVENKMILTARRERITDKLIDILKKLNIEFPNFGLFLYPDRTNVFSSRWKAEKMIEISKKNDFTEINYYDDNIKQIKKISKFLKESNININIYKVNENSYKKYEN